MTISEAIKARHSVRSYISKAISQDIKQQLQKEIEKCNKESGLHIQLVTEDAKAFDSFLAHYGKFDNVQNYIALIGKKSVDLEEKTGYYGEKIALFAQTLGLNTCWVAMTFRKGAAKQSCKVGSGEKLVCVIALGYGKSQGVSHKIKEINEVCKDDANMPDWYKQGLECALLAPTAMNQQKFMFSRNGNVVAVKSTGGFYSKIDLGIVKYHFETGAGTENFKWELGEN